MDSVEVMAGLVHQHPQKSYAGLKISLQQECDFVQCVTPGIREAFRPVEEALHISFLPAHFCGATADILD